MQRRFQILVALALCLSVGLHWSFLQAVAWTGMLATYASQGSLSQALQKTFDGQHPCKLCKIVRAGCESDSKQCPGSTVSKLDPWLHTEQTLFFFPQLIFHPVSVTLAGLTRSEPPPLPPPLVA